MLQKYEMYIEFLHFLTCLFEDERDRKMEKEFQKRLDEFIKRKK